MRGESVEDAQTTGASMKNLDSLPPFRLGDFTVQPTLHRLIAGDRMIQLEPKIMGVLLALASEPGAVVSRQALQQTVWGTPHVSEDLPRRAISILRKNLGDNPKVPSYIETIPRAGYRLLVPIERLSTVSIPRTETRPRRPEDARAIAPPPNRPQRSGAFIICLLMLAILLSFGLLRPDHSTKDHGASDHRASDRVPRVIPMATLPGPEFDPAISPDGSRIAFLRAADTSVGAALTLEVQLCDSASSITVSEAHADFGHPIESPTWSPDGTRIAYRRWRAGLGWALYEVPALGGPERLIHELGRGATSGLSWSPDGHTLVLGRSPAEGMPIALQRFDLRSGTLTTLTEPAATTVGDLLPSFSPDGKTIAFARSITADAAALHRVSIDGKDGRTLDPGPHKIADLDWSADGKFLIVAQFQAGRHRLVRLDIATGKAEPLAAAGEGARWLSVSRASDRLVYGQARFELAVREVDLEGAGSQTLPSLSSTFFDEGLALSPVGDRLALVSTRSGSYELWTLGFAGESPMRLSNFGGARVGRPTWVEDGKRLVFEANPEGTFDLWTVSAAGGSPRQLTHRPGEDRVPSASLDGTHVYFGSDRSGRWQVWSIPASGGPAEQITRSGGYYARPSPDATWLYYTRFKQHGLWRQRLDRPLSTTEQVLEDVPRSWDGGNWLVRDEGIWSITYDDHGNVFLSLFDPESRRALRQVALPTTPVQPSLTHSPRHGRLLLATVDRVESDLIRIDGYSRRPRRLDAPR